MVVYGAQVRHIWAHTKMAIIAKVAEHGNIALLDCGGLWCKAVDG
jgi:hypothetical protein